MHTATTESRAASANISAQETTPGQDPSTCCLMKSITSNPRKEFALCTDSFSPPGTSKSNDASHPYIPYTYILIY